MGCRLKWWKGVGGGGLQPRTRGASSMAAMFWGGGAPLMEGGMVVGRGRASLESGLLQSRRRRCKDAGEGACISAAWSAAIPAPSMQGCRRRGRGLDSRDDGAGGRGTASSMGGRHMRGRGRGHGGVAISLPSMEGCGRRGWEL
jgi:hypothetical protein